MSNNPSKVEIIYIPSPPTIRYDTIVDYEWIVDNPEWWPIYECKRFKRFDIGDNTHSGYTVFKRLNDDVIELLWCVNNCRGYFTVFSDWMCGGDPGREEGYVFELAKDALMFKLTWGGIL